MGCINEVYKSMEFHLKPCGGNNQSKNFNNNMENFKLDLSKLTPVAEKDRVQGNWYVVANKLSLLGVISQWHCSNSRIDPADGGMGLAYKYWFAIPPNLPGFPVATTPDIITLPLSEWAYSYNSDVIVLHRKKYVSTLVIPAGTVDERRKRLQEELEKLNK